MGALARFVAWKRPFWCCGVAFATACLLVAALGFLRPTDAQLWPASVRGATYRGELRLGTVALERRDGRWRGRATDFPAGTATHFQLTGAYGLYVVRLGDGRLLVLVDRGARYGQRVYWYDPLPFRPHVAPPIAGFRDHTHGSAYYADGSRLSGPVWRPLDPFPLEDLGDTFSFADRAQCSAMSPMWTLREPPREPWCR